MTRKNKYLIIALAAVLVSCSTAELEPDFVEYDLSLFAQVRGTTDPGTKAALYNAESEIRSKTLTVYGWEGSRNLINGAGATYSSGSWGFPTTYKMKTSGSYLFYSYTNLPAQGVTTPACTTSGIDYTVTDISAAQEDVLLGRGKVKNPESGDVDLTYSHPYASVKFKLGSVDGVNTVSAISLSGIYRSGTAHLDTTSVENSDHVVQYSWTGLGDASGTVSRTGLSVTEGEIATFVVIPQQLSTLNAVLTVTYDGGSLTKTLNSGTWNAGYTTTYTLGHVDAVDVAVTDVVSGKVKNNLNIVNNSRARVYIRATMAGAWYKDGQIVAPWEPTDGTFSGLPGSGWSKVGDLYYYANPINANGGTPSTPLFVSYTRPDSPVTGAHLELSILVQAIPYNINKTCREAFEEL